MSKVCVLLADGFEEIEAVTIIDVLRRAELDVETVAVATSEDATRRVTGSHGIPVEADISLDTAVDAEWDAVILPGGLPGATNLRDDERVQDLLRRQNNAGRAVGAICAGPIALANAGVLEGRQATCYPGFEDQLTGSSPCTDPVVVDGNVFTSRGVGTALSFALTLVARLRDESTAATLRDRMLVST